MERMTILLSIRKIWDWIEDHYLVTIAIVLFTVFILVLKVSLAFDHEPILIALNREPSRRFWVNCRIIFCFNYRGLATVLQRAYLERVRMKIHLILKGFSFGYHAALSLRVTIFNNSKGGVHMPFYYLEFPKGYGKRRMYQNYFFLFDENNQERKKVPIEVGKVGISCGRPKGRET